MTRIIYILLYGFFIISPIESIAGEPFTYYLNLKIVGVETCKKLSVENVLNVSQHASSSWSNSQLQEFVRDNAGYVLGVSIKERRDVSWPNMFFIDVDSRKDSGWKKVQQTNIQHFYVSKNDFDSNKIRSCHDLNKGTLLNVMLPDKNLCDTLPATGVCAFDNPMQIADPVTWKQYGK